MERSPQSIIDGARSERSCNRDGTVTATTNCHERTGFPDAGTDSYLAPVCHQGQWKDSLHQSRRCGCGSGRRKLCVAPAEREFLYVARIHFSSGQKTRAAGIHSNPSLDSGERVFCRRDQALLNRRIRPSGERWKGIHCHPHLQEESQIPRGILDWLRSPSSRTDSGRLGVNGRRIPQLLRLACMSSSLCRLSAACHSPPASCRAERLKVAAFPSLARLHQPWILRILC